MKTISKQLIRTKRVASVLASLRIERLAPSHLVVKGVHDCVSGQKATYALLLEVLQRHVALRRN